MSFLSKLWVVPKQSNQEAKLNGQKLERVKNFKIFQKYINSIETDKSKGIMFATAQIGISLCFLFM